MVNLSFSKKKLCCYGNDINVPTEVTVPYIKALPKWWSVFVGSIPRFITPWFATFIVMGTLFTGPSYMDIVAVPDNARLLLFMTLAVRLKSDMLWICPAVPSVLIILINALKAAALGGFVWFIFNGCGIAKSHCPDSIQGNREQPQANR